MTDTPKPPVEMLQWLRASAVEHTRVAAEHTRLADEIERVFPHESAGESGHQQNGYIRKAPPRSQLTVKDIVDMMKGRSLRLPTMVEELHVPDNIVLTLLTEDNGFARNHRGWYTYTEPES
jgi:hypothetical protein